MVTAVPFSYRAKSTNIPPPVIIGTQGGQKENFNGTATTHHFTLDQRILPHLPSAPLVPYRHRSRKMKKTTHPVAEEEKQDTQENRTPSQQEENEDDKHHPIDKLLYSTEISCSREPVKPVNFPLYLRAPLKRMITEINEAYSQRPSVPSGQERGDEEDLPGTASRLPYQFISDHILSSIRTLGTTNSVDDAWNAYVFLSDLIAANAMVNKHIPHIPFSHLHRLCRLLSRNRPKTHGQFLRLLAVLTYIRHHNGIIHVHEWNALIDHAGKGWRKTRPQNVKNAMSIFNDMAMGRMPGSVDFLPPEAAELSAMSSGTVVEPNIITYTTLISHAAGAMDSHSIIEVSAMLSKAGLPPNRITYLALLRYFTQKRNLGGLRSTLEKMKEQNLELGLDGVNSCIWAYGLAERLEIVMMIYRVLRHNHIPESCTESNNISSIATLLEDEFIIIQPEMQPDHITYTTVIQILAYHGHFDAALNVFLDMMSVQNMEERLVDRTTGDMEPLILPYQPTFPIFRALFLGFSRHATPPSQKHVPGSTLDQDWTHHKLQSIFDLFLQLPPDTDINHSTIYMIFKAFQKTSGGDMTLLRSIWEALDKRFKIEIKANSSSRLARLKNDIFGQDWTS
ncbi:hypothetical protein CVT24_002044 [Panaeolus cyanescens]|uniref:Pentacotripeptide-repeat region of PRORP domain-containing protein n=1 Tax=Panaeolus cyanescens TaxID=181874 RepID=A0A409YHN7_9AGAR|nr:hypothetical protein CVT24_002044 [Panaeolus cyanescens]